GVVLERLLEAASLLDALELEEEVGMEEVAAEFAVGDRLEAKAFLPFDEVGDRLVFDRAKFGIVDVARGPVLARFDNRARTQEGADMVGAGRQLCRHGVCPVWQRLIFEPGS